jgi:hypothetical protein
MHPHKELMIRPIALALSALAFFQFSPTYKTLTFKNESKRAVWVTVYGNPMHNSPIIKAFCVEGGTTKTYDKYNKDAGNETKFEMKEVKDTCKNPKNISVKEAAMLKRDVTIRDTGITY